MSGISNITGDDVFSRAPLPQLGFRLLWEAVADVDGRADLGRGPLGERFLVLVTGGRFRGGPAVDGRQGVILPGGVDRQLLRTDGVKELDASYEMKTEAGIVLGNRNRVIVGTSQAARPERQAVVIRAWEVGTA